MSGHAVPGKTGRCATPAPARADALRIQFPTQVAAGGKPQLVISADEAVDGITITLRDDGGRSTNAKVPALAAGAQYQMDLPASPGRQR